MTNIVDLAGYRLKRRKKQGGDFLTRLDVGVVTDQFVQRMTRVLNRSGASTVLFFFVILLLV